ncbi:DUF4124 domain-containing protein [Stutzerimonas tarimensis]|uniref:DUF4124 domain-containing protein n=1 Tax=Stutzerimonas tarimensis TaxID=1507735 RepID=A0ABV7T3N4_9GAMM
MSVGLLLATLQVGAVELYRYVDESGAVVFDRHGVPPHLIGSGYQVLNDKGRVLRSVAPAPSAEERQRLQQEAEQALADARLLRLYAAVEEVDAAKLRKLSQLDSVSGIARSSLRAVNRQLQRLQVEEQRLLAEQQDVPESLRQQMLNLRQERLGLERNVESYRAARLAAEVSFTSDRERLAVLLGGLTPELVVD